MCLPINSVFLFLYINLSVCHAFQYFLFLLDHEFCHIGLISILYVRKLGFVMLKWLASHLSPTPVMCSSMIATSVIILMSTWTDWNTLTGLVDHSSGRACRWLTGKLRTKEGEATHPAGLEPGWNEKATRKESALQFLQMSSTFGRHLWMFISNFFCRLSLPHRLSNRLTAGSAKCSTSQPSPGSSHTPGFKWPFFLLLPLTYQLPIVSLLYKTYKSLRVYRVTVTQHTGTA